MNEKIQKTLEENVNPILADHFGGAKLVSFEDKVATVRLTGACATCPSARFTLENVVKEIVMEHCEGVEDVILDMSASDELLDMAKELMEKKE
ncbi:MAG: NifU family protein [Clostridiales bacterium]|nr:NifU family protein [Clostridiales bacterium]